MKRCSFADLASTGPEHVAAALIPGKRICGGGLSFHTPGMRTHDEGTHVHDHEEVFAILQGQGQIVLAALRVYFGSVHRKVRVCLPLWLRQGIYPARQRVPPPSNVQFVGRALDDLDHGLILP